MPYDYEEVEVQTVPGRGSGTKQEMEPADQVREGQCRTNEILFSALTTQHDQAARDVNYLEQALDAARTRERVLGAAMKVLNEPQQAPSSLR